MIIYIVCTVTETFQLTFVTWRGSLLTMYGLHKECFILLSEFFSRDVAVLLINIPKLVFFTNGSILQAPGIFFLLCSTIYIHN